VQQSAGHEIIEAADGKACLDLFRRHAPAVVLIDVMMPEKDGLAKAIAISGGRVFTPEVYLASGADGALCKPVRPRQRIAAIESMLQTEAPNHPMHGMACHPGEHSQ
jgi:CheY-like chemotaxis protein